MGKLHNGRNPASAQGQNRAKAKIQALDCKPNSHDKKKSHLRSLILVVEAGGLESDRNRTIIRESMEADFISKTKIKATTPTEEKKR